MTRSHTARLGLLLTPEDRATITARAAARRLAVSEYLRRTGLGSFTVEETPDGWRAVVWSGVRIVADSGWQPTREAALREVG